ncbi:glutathione peroxidase [Allohahella sp. A8]|uniref:glutathione peroxidase n=1 Tax=Allohahella sp. A8 TaxID=3141461 RepID=UPI000C09A912|nr:glutathione peroxidase [Hahellaceae bacterium]|tara:strand:- start:86570 stop:87046 length:477 start_codon:yes stop_codon:yes gene_type:complete
MGIYEYSAKDIKGQERKLEEFAGKVLLIVNTASKCGFTPQFEGLEALYDTYKDRGLIVLGFPCNQFLKQDPKGDSEIAEFCQKNYGVSFPMFGKIEVNGEGTHPLFAYLKKEAKGLLGSEAVKWNFTKFLVDREGNVVNRFPPNTEPKKLKEPIEALL